MCSWRGHSNQCGGVNVDYKETVIPYPISCGHDASIGNGNVGCCPYPVYWELTPKEGGDNLLARVGSYNLLHCQRPLFCERIPDPLFVDILICVEAYYDAASCRPPYLQELDKIFAEFCMRACPMVLLVHYKEPLLLLIAVDIDLVESPFQHTCLKHLQDCVVNGD
jgi:hypothetical protein